MAYSAKTASQLIDIHVHGARVHDTGTRRRDDILSIAEIHGQRGTGAIVPTVAPGPIAAMRESLERVGRFESQRARERLTRDFQADKTRCLLVNKILVESCTDIDRDGAMGGPNIAATEALARAVSVPVIASGGVSSMADLIRLRDTGVIAGAISGRALYDGAIDLKAALAALAS